ncbi:MAG: lipoprotein-releasing ABC transporter permease subunit [Gammaproteobacteria bacterium]|nr:lipoprotein-releasing ABC transporter permease subunit [Gammaproteobacteria bacterium]
MFRPFEAFIGLRYTRAKRRNHFISFISFISIIGIALGVTALITVLSVMNGFEKELRERILGMASHATISALAGPLRNWQQVAADADRHPDVVGAAPYIEGQAMLVNGRLVSGVLIRGVLPEAEPRVSEVSERMVSGALDTLSDGDFGIVLGRELSQFLGVYRGDRVTLITPEASVTPVGVLPRIRRFTVVGVYEVGMYEYDRTMAFMHIGDAARLFRQGDGVTGVRLRLQDMFEARRVARELAHNQKELWVSDWTRKHANFFRAVQTEKTVMFVILTLIVAVAAFNIVSTLVMVVTDKQADIAILRTLGASPRSIMWIFLIQGGAIGVLGTLLGVAGGVTLSLNVTNLVPALESLFGIKFLSPDVYYISDLPSDMHLVDVLRIAALSFVLTLAATIYPARRAARTDPAEALRYE